MEGERNKFAAFACSVQRDMVISENITNSTEMPSERSQLMQSPSVTSVEHESDTSLFSQCRLQFSFREPWGLGNMSF